MFKHSKRAAVGVETNVLHLPQYSYSSLVEEYNALVYVKRRDTFHVDSAPHLRGERDKDGLCLCFTTEGLIMAPGFMQRSDHAVTPRTQS